MTTPLATGWTEIGRLGAPLARLRRWHAAVASRLRGPVDVLCIGDSITEGTGASSRDTRWLSRLRDTLRMWYPTALAPGGEGYIPTFTMADYPHGWNYGGNISSNGTLGLARRSVILKGSDGYCERSVYGTSVVVAYSTSPASGSFEILVDGTVAATVTATTAAGSGIRGGGRQAVSLGTRGQHTVRIRWKTGTECLISGLFIYDGDETRGIRMIDSGQHGSTAGNWSRITSPSTAYLLGDEMAATPPALVVLGLGPNDMIQGRTPAAYEADMRDIIAQCRAAVPNVPILLHVAYQLAADYTYPWSNYVDVMVKIADDTADVELLRFDQRLPRANANPYLMIATDGVHPNDLGHQFYAARISDTARSHQEPEIEPPTIRAALDYDNSVAPTADQAMLFQAGSGKFAPRSVELPGNKSTAGTAVPNGYIGADAAGNVPAARQYAAGLTSYGVTRLRMEAGSAAPGDHVHGVTGVSATGTPDATTFWRGDNTWSAGPVGPRGFTGDKGDKGDKGADGTAGSQGPPGPSWIVRLTNQSGAVAAGEAVWFDASGGTRDATLPASPATGDRVFIGKPDNSLNPVRILATVNGDTDGVRILSPDMGVTLLYTGATFGWQVESATPGGFIPGTPPSVEMRLTTAYTNLASGDYFMSGNMSMIGSDPYSMFSTAFGFYRVIIPITGRYDVEWNWNSSQTSGNAAAKIALNVPNGQNATVALTQSAATTMAVMTDFRAGGGETPVGIHRTRMFNAGDTLAFLIYSSVQFSMPVTVFGNIDTRFRVAYLGRV